MESGARRPEGPEVSGIKAYGRDSARGVEQRLRARRHPVPERHFALDVLSEVALHFSDKRNVIRVPLGYQFVQSRNTAPQAPNSYAKTLDVCRFLHMQRVWFPSINL